ncbi:GNAT family N-acetyltransferase [Evansella sp. AB-P1]|uniref:GNAT family N-acetyltransferase n=1 Tax=Evansella sp. AB-P1 TaxID=3037653 RepID=UPI00241C4FA8|nr:GNAT family N-acetyltransferase [Evansella sp. AB-P1]MDG5786110.1 GNAT family N-acetyltransferase [Evansella sp. AB-P1]
MNIRKLNESEIDLSIELSEYAFQFNLSEEERRERRKLVQPDNTWVAEENHTILSKASVLPFHTYIHGQKIPMGGVSGVATWPEHRRNGMVKELLFHSLKEMKESGQLLSFLYPFSIPFYRKYGWELFAEKQTVTLTKEQLPKRIEVPGYVKRVSSESCKELDSIYQIWAIQYNGTLVREENWWHKSILRKKDQNIAIYYNKENTPNGYMIYQVKSETMTVKEIIWLNPESRNGLFSFISNHDSMIKKVIITTSPNGELPFILPDPKVEREVQSYFMGRIVDLKSFLENYPFSLPEEDYPPIVLHISDEFCPWNDGTFFIRCQTEEAIDQGINIDFFQSKKSEGATCQHPPKKGIRLSIQTLTALLLNAQSMDLLYQEGLILGDVNTAKLFDQIIPKRKAFIYDFF